MSEVTVRHLGGREFEVAVGGGGRAGSGSGSGSTGTVHVVRVDDATLTALGGDTPPSEGELGRLVAASFDFLLEREPATSILRRFDLAVIESYFPGYFSDIRERMERTDPGRLR